MTVVLQCKVTIDGLNICSHHMVSNIETNTLAVAIDG